ncbi:hypothetical protein [Sphingobium ummariense]
MDSNKVRLKGKPQVRRARADQLIAQMVTEAEAVNADPTMIHRVTLLAVFGSYLGDKPVLGDLDIAIKFDALWEPDTYKARRRQFMEDHPPPEYVRRDYFGRMFWPETVLRRRMKIGRGISLHDFSELLLMECPYLVVFGEPPS